MFSYCVINGQFLIFQSHRVLPNVLIVSVTPCIYVTSCVRHPVFNVGSLLTVRVHEVSRLFSVEVSGLSKLRSRTIG